MTTVLKKTKACWDQFKSKNLKKRIILVPGIPKENLKEEPIVKYIMVENFLEQKKTCILYIQIIAATRI